MRQLTFRLGVTIKRRCWEFLLGVYTLCQSQPPSHMGQRLVPRPFTARGNDGLEPLFFIDSITESNLQQKGSSPPIPLAIAATLSVSVLQDQYSPLNNWTPDPLSKKKKQE